MSFACFVVPLFHSLRGKILRIGDGSSCPDELAQIANCSRQSDGDIPAVRALQNARLILGGLLGYYGWPLPMVETGIALSVVIMGMAIATGVRLPTIAAMTLVGIFALFHGHAHGNEGAGLGIAFLPYATGFVIATGLLHVSGIALGAGFDRLGATSSRVLNKLAGGVGMIAGVSLLAGWLAA